MLLLVLIERTGTSLKFMGELDPSAVDALPVRPIGFGYESGRLHVHREGRNAFEPTQNPFATIVRYVDSDPLVSGYVSPANIERLSGLGSVIAERSGDGAVILFADDPFFRAYWLGTAGLVMNALYFGTAFDPPYRPAG